MRSLLHEGACEFWYLVCTGKQRDCGYTRGAYPEGPGHVYKVQAVLEPESVAA